MLLVHTCILHFCRRALLKRGFERRTIELQVLEAAELWNYCFLDWEALVSSHTCLAESTAGKTSFSYFLMSRMCWLTLKASS